MYEIEIRNANNDVEFIYGHSVKDAFRRNPQFSPDEWKVCYKEYID